jgi:hypothetical protein
MLNRYFIFILILILAGSCNYNVKVESSQSDEEIASTGAFGLQILAEDAADATEIESLFTDTDAIDTKLKGKLTACCQHSGCWMDMDIGNGNTMNVTFKDGEFTIPKDAAGKKAIIQGTAYRELIPVNKLKAFAKDEGKTEEEINQITEPAYEYTFVAEGVIIEE